MIKNGEVVHMLTWLYKFRHVESCSCLGEARIILLLCMLNWLPFFLNVEFSSALHFAFSLFFSFSVSALRWCCFGLRCTPWVFALDTNGSCLAQFNQCLLKAMHIASYVDVLSSFISRNCFQTSIGRGPLNIKSPGNRKVIPSRLTPTISFLCWSMKNMGTNCTILLTTWRTLFRLVWSLIITILFIDLLPEPSWPISDSHLLLFPILLLCGLFFLKLLPLPLLQEIRYSYVYNLKEREREPITNLGQKRQEPRQLRQNWGIHFTIPL